jgi:hypothetical protein
MLTKTSILKAAARIGRPPKHSPVKRRRFKRQAPSPGLVAPSQFGQEFQSDEPATFDIDIDAGVCNDG